MDERRYYADVAVAEHNFGAGVFVAGYSDWECQGDRWIRDILLRHDAEPKPTAHEQFVVEFEPNTARVHLVTAA